MSPFLRLISGFCNRFVQTHRTEGVTVSEGDGKERTGLGAGLESGTGTEIVTRSGVGTGT